jgi:predicted short-subunit dehydrogenase-like oxidoreductase (DUF2520 family)
MEGIKEKGFGLIGAGRVGSFFATLLSKKGFKILGISDIKRNRARELSQSLKLRKIDWENEELAKASDILFCATPDDMILNVYKEVEPYLKPKAIFAHFSGSLSAREFPKNASILSLHPIYTFTAEDKKRVRAHNFPKIPFALEGTKEGIEFGKELMKEFGAQYVIIPSEKKALYHLACLFFSNFLWADIQIGFRLIKGLIKEKEILFPLANATIANAFQYPARVSITGPIVRGDKETIKRHLGVLKSRFPEYLFLYKNLSRVIFDALKGSLSAEDEKEIKSLLR